MSALLPRWTVIATLTGSVALAAAGCSHKYSADGVSGLGATEVLAPRPDDGLLGLRGGRDLFPLAVGNRWDYLERWRSTLVTDAGPLPLSTGEESLRVEIIGTDDLGREYFEQKMSSPGSNPLSQFTYVRKDRSGLYQYYPGGGYVRDADAVDGRLARELEAYVGRTIPDAGRRAAFQRAAAAVAATVEAARRGAGGAPAAARGADPLESTRLSFPLFVGARWLEFEGSRSMLTVVAREPVQVPSGAVPAWKIRWTSPLLGPADRTFSWYGSAGVLREQDHFERDAVDTLGNVVGRVVIDNELLLTGLHLVPAMAGGQ